MGTNLTAEQHREQAAKSEQAAADSFERCDTDGFLSQWALGLTAQEHRAKANLIEAGGVAEFRALFDAETGERVRAKLIDGRYGMCWAFADADDQFTGRFVKAFPKREQTMLNKGFREGYETVPAYVCLEGRGRGLSGTAWVATKRKDKGYPADAKVVV